MIKDTEELLKEIKKLCRKFAPEGYYYVDKLVRKGQTAIVLHLLYDSPEDEDYYPKEGGE